MIRSLDALDSKFSILGPVHLPVIANNHAGHVLSALNMRNVERFNASGKVRQLECLLELLEHEFHVWFKHAKSLFEGQLRVLVDQIDHVALLTALRIQDPYASYLTQSQRFLQKSAVFEINRHV